MGARASAPRPIGRSRRCCRRRRCRWRLRTPFVDHSFREDGELTLRYWRDGWWHWKRSHWQEVEYRAIRSLLYRFTEHAWYMTPMGSAPWAPNRKKIGDVLEALQAVCILPQDTDQPTWLDGR